MFGDVKFFWGALFIVLFLVATFALIIERKSDNPSKLRTAFLSLMIANALIRSVHLLVILQDTVSVIGFVLDIFGFCMQYTAKMLVIGLWGRIVLSFTVLSVRECRKWSHRWNIFLGVYSTLVCLIYAWLVGYTISLYGHDMLGPIPNESVPLRSIWILVAVIDSIAVFAFISLAVYLVTAIKTSAGFTFQDYSFLKVVTVAALISALSAGLRAALNFAAEISPMYTALCNSNFSFCLSMNFGLTECIPQIAIVITMFYLRKKFANMRSRINNKASGRLDVNPLIQVSSM